MNIRLPFSAALVGVALFLPVTATAQYLPRILPPVKADDTQLDAAIKAANDCVDRENSELRDLVSRPRSKADKEVVGRTLTAQSRSAVCIRTLDDEGRRHVASHNDVAALSFALRDLSYNFVLQDQVVYETWLAYSKDEER